MHKLTLRKNYAHRNGIEWCDIDLVFTVDGVEQFKDSLNFRSTELRHVLRSLALPSEMVWPAKRMDISPWKLQKMLRRLNSYAEWEIRDGQAVELPQESDKELVLDAVRAGATNLAAVARHTRLSKSRVERAVAQLLEVGALVRRKPEHSAIRVARILGLI